MIQKKKKSLCVFNFVQTIPGIQKHAFDKWNQKHAIKIDSGVDIKFIYVFNKSGCGSRT